MTNYLIGADQKIHDRLVKIYISGEVETAIRLSIKPWVLATWPK